MFDRIDFDNPSNIVLVLIIVFVSGFFVGSQYELCVAMPDEWFTGFVSGLVLVLCLLFLFRQRE